MIYDFDHMSDERILQHAQKMRGSFKRIEAIRTFVNTIAESDIEEFQQVIREEDTGYCALCIEEAVMRDILSIPWCQEHQLRGNFIAIMAKRHWKGIEHAEFFLENGEDYYYSIGSGVLLTLTIALYGYDEGITALALKALELEQKEKIA